MQFDSKKIMFIFLFAVIAFITSRINFSQLLGAENQFFTVFQFFGPIAGAFLGPVLGGAAVFLSEATNFILLGKAVDPINILRLFPMVFAAYYFANSGKKNLSLIVPVLAILAFWLNPVGREAWYFALFWTIPIIARFVAPNNLFAKSLGATFTAHSVGGAIWVYVFPTTAIYWAALVPIVITERLMFALGISVSFVAMTTILSRLEHMVSGVISLDKRYDVLRLFAQKA